MLGADALRPAVGAASGCGNPSAAGSQPVTLTVDAKPRTALVHTPPQAAAGRRLPLVIALHGVGGSGPRMEGYSGLSVVADRLGFIVAYPTSHGTFWNSTASPRLTNDVQFIRGLIAYLRQSMCIDAARIYVAGVSNGGGMAALAGCQLSAQISGFASVAGSYDRQPPCRPNRPESVLEIHGTADQVVPYYRHGAHVGVPQFVAGWVRRDRCRGRAAESHPATRTTMFRWDNCAGVARVEHIRITGGRHAWPGATPPDSGPPSTICAACVVGNFFTSLRPRARG